MAAITSIESVSDRWKQARVGELSQDFLRIGSADPSQNAASVQPTPAAANANWNPYPAQCLVPSHYGRLLITCVQAKLSRNYGITRMDPYVRIRVGNFVYETQTSQNGGKNPYWNRAIQCQLTAGIEIIHIEIYDECSFKMDELIAWADVPIPETLFQGKTHEGTYALSGKQGEGQEGSIDIVLSYSLQPFTYPIAGTSFLVGSNARPIVLTPVHQANMYQQAPPPQPIALSNEDFLQVREMFPNMDEQVVRTIFEANNGNKATTINCLLQLNE
ncbi:toll-interacting protein B-like [Scaptodrosophila lebanonensis]|uniref:Toll-interacting protein B-like n=1 Tax=Drosophila lebanonensis TaxID=7225 RepID=A0A6J2TUH1_DROLE|nr:toll-interacting protein B-like [Scaptodrosophila lebanonensis]